MRFLFIRHGEPDYINDCLTPTGRLQAKAAAKRLAGEGICEIYASPLGRAQETAGYTAEALGLKITTLDFMREISWGGEGVPNNGHIWTLADRMLKEDNFDFFKADWREHPYFKKNIVMQCYEKVVAGIDGFLEGQGYRHEGRRFLCTQENSKTIALFSHGGSGGAALSHILSLPFPYVLCVFPYTYTSVIAVDFPSEPGAYVHPRVELFNDAAHIKGLGDALKIQQKSI